MLVGPDKPTETPCLRGIIWYARANLTDVKRPARVVVSFQGSSEDFARRKGDAVRCKTEMGQFVACAQTKSACVYWGNCENFAYSKN